MITSVTLLFLLLLTLSVPPLAYLLWARRNSRKPWNLERNHNYSPKVSLVIATYNEAKVIGRKLENVNRMNYPEDKLEVIVIDSASTDGTLDVCKAYLDTHKNRFPISLISENERLGKSHALNTALANAKGEIIATSDADSFWDPDALQNAVSFFVDSSVGAVTGREKITNLKRSIYATSEGLYRKFYYTLRFAESKISSTLIFQGELSLYRRSVFEKFEDKAGCSDDTGTIINIISKGFRCIFTPDSVFSDNAAFSFGGRLAQKSRRAEHLIAGVLKSLRLKFSGRFPICWSIILFSFYFHVVSPLLLLFTGVVAIFIFLVYFQSLWFVLLFIPLVLVRKVRLFLASYLTGNIALFFGLLQNLRRDRSSYWRKIDEMR